jgi:hypothetical protein
LIDQSRVSLLPVPWPFRFQIHHLRLRIQSIKQSASLSLLFPQMHTELRAPSLSRLPAVSSSSSQKVLLPTMTFLQKSIRKRSIDHAWLLLKSVNLPEAGRSASARTHMYSKHTNLRAKQ